MRLILDGIGIGIAATLCIDIWAAIARNFFGLPTANWAMVGRWFGNMSRGVFRHQSIASAAPIRGEVVLGWTGHYLIGISYGIAYLLVVQMVFAAEPSLISALGFGLVTLFAPWLVMQPAMGAGVFASRTPRPAVARLMNLVTHAVFGAALYLGWRLIP